MQIENALQNTDLESSVTPPLMDELFGEIIGTMAQGLVVFSDKYILFANDAIADVLDIPIWHFVEGRPLLEYLNYSCERGDYGADETGEKVVERLLEKMRQGENYRAYRVLPNGRHVRVDARSRSGGGGIITYTDVTEQMNLSNEVERSDARLEKFALTAADWLWGMDADLRFNYFSDDAGRCWGIDVDALIGKTRSDLPQQEHHKELFAAHQKRLLEREAFRDFTYDSINTKGEKIWLAVSGTPMFSTGGEFEGYIGTCRDVTHIMEQKLQIEEVKRNLEITVQALNTCPLGILVHSGEEVIYSNSCASRLLEVPKEMLVSGAAVEPICAFLADRETSDDGAVAGKSANIIGYSRDSALEHFEHEFTTPQGRILRVNGREVDGIVIDTYTDITDLRAAEQSASNADRAKSEFLANMSHEIRTPMNGVMGMAELLAKTKLDSKQKMFTDVIVKSGASLLTIINDVLDFSKLDVGQMELDLAPFVLSDAIEDVATLMSSSAWEKGIELIIRVDPTLPEMIVGDVGRIRQVITNLMGNAVKFTAEGHVFVNVLPCGEPTEDGTQRIHFDVKDTGIGIPDHDLGKIFDKFSQVDSSATRRHEGTGLGLSISSSLIELMDGEIGVESTVDKGSRFWFEIEVPIHGEARAKRIPSDVSNSRILVIDDNAVNRAILKEQTANWQFDTAAASSGEEGLATMRAAKRRGIVIDCVILDYQMPDMNGGDVVREMKEDPLLRDIPVIMLTSVDETEDGKAFSSLGIQNHLVKPARSSLLLETIIEVIETDRTAKMSDDGDEQFLPSSWLSGSDTMTAATVEQAAPPPAPEKSEKDDKHEPDLTSPPAMATVVSAHPSAADGTHKDGKVAIASTIDILLCEDNEINQIVFTQILDASPYSYRIANNGREGLALYEAMNPTMILMDVSMPHMNGIEATLEIRKREEGGRHTPIVAVTAHALKGDMEKCFEAGMDDYLSKPVSFDALTAKINKWMKKERQVA